MGKLKASSCYSKAVHNLLSAASQAGPRRAQETHHSGVERGDRAGARVGISGHRCWARLHSLLSVFPSQYLQLKKKLEDEFPGCVEVCGEGTPQVTGFFEVMVAGKLIHSKKRGDGYVDSESKYVRLVTAIKTALAQA
ncbi:selenoprotein W [Suncus etruscus]|uniref:selenoprotein W n=1 Tax=Suncus etruscus TaxID=109475 RepID=UPI00211006B6|nr:selenoprotein W [Suncus etruscus]